MKKITTIFITLSVLFISCSDKDDRITIKETFDNGQPKITIHKTKDEKNSYYEISYDSLGRIKEIIPYSNGLKNGTQIYFRENLDVCAFLSNKNNKRHGFTYEFYEGLQIAFKAEEINGQFNGLTTSFYKNGNVKETGIKTNGKGEAEWIEYHENGRLKAKGTYINGIKQNDWTYWNSDGTIDLTNNK